MKGDKYITKRTLSNGVTHTDVWKEVYKAGTKVSVVRSKQFDKVPFMGTVLEFEEKELIKI